MKITIDTKALQGAIKSLKPIVPATSTQPVLKNFLFHSEDDILTITASNLELTMSIRLNVSSDDQSERDFLLEASFFTKLVSSLKDKELVLEFDEDFHTCAVHTKKGLLDFVIEAPEFYPEISSSEFECKPSITLNTDIFLSAVKQSVAYHISSDDRTQLKGTFAKEHDGSLYIYSTDVHKMLRYAMDIERQSADASDMNFIIPEMATKLISSISGEDSITVVNGDSKVMIKNNTTSFIFTKLELAYPNCDKVIPAPSETVLNINKEDLIDTLKQVQVLSTSEACGIMLSNDNGLVHVSLNDFTMGRNADVQVDSSLIKENTLAPNLQVGLNVNILLDIISSVSTKNVALHIGDPVRPVIIREVNDKSGTENPDIDMLIMPIKL